MTVRLVRPTMTPSCGSKKASRRLPLTDDADEACDQPVGDGIRTAWYPCRRSSCSIELFDRVPPALAATCHCPGPPPAWVVTEQESVFTPDQCAGATADTMAMSAFGAFAWAPGAGATGPCSGAVDADARTDQPGVNGP